MSNTLEPNFNGLPKPTDWKKVIVPLQQANEKEFRGATLLELGDNLNIEMSINAQRVPAVPPGALVAGPTDREVFMEIKVAGSWTWGTNPPLTNAEGNIATFYWDKTDWKKNDEVALPTPEGTNKLEEGGTLLINQDAGFHVDKKINFLSKISSNIFDKNSSNLELGSVIATGPVASTSNFRAVFSKDVLKPGKKYRIRKKTTVSTSSHVAAVYMNALNEVISYVARVTGAYEYTIAPPVGVEKTIVHIGFLLNADTYPLHDNLVVNEVMLVEGVVSQDYIPFGQIVGVDTDKIEGYSAVKQLAADEPIIEVPKKNRIDTSKIDFSKRYSPNSKSIVSSGGTRYALTGWLSGWADGQSYSISTSFGSTLPAGLTYTGGYYKDKTDTNAVEDIVFINTANQNGSGKMFTVPSGKGITGGYINVIKTANDSNELIGKFQLESGELATEIVEFELTKVFNPKYLIQNIVQPKFVTLPSPQISVNLPKFTEKYFTKSEDLTIVLVGTSLLTDRYSQARPDISSRPPLLGYYNFASYLWDKLSANWAGQLYRRYDWSDTNGVKFFSETGSFTTVNGLADWDDFNRRNGWTRYSDTPGAGISWLVPAAAWQHNFIYRTDLSGGDCTINIEEGPGKIEVYNETIQTWVEASGFVFSMKEPAVTLTKGNTTYQKRLKMRCKSELINSIGSIKHISIVNNGTGRFLFWGIETSYREKMARLLNASRGSHAWKNPTDDMSLMKFQDNDIYPYNPNLIMSELTGINYGASTFSVIPNRTEKFYTDIIYEWIFNPAQPLGMANMTSSFEEIETIFFSDTVTVLEDAFDPNTGAEKFAFNKSGKTQTCIDNYHAINNYMLKKNVNYIDMFSYFKEFAEASYGTLYHSMIRSGVSGNTLSYDGTHWNHNGDKLVASILLPLFDFK